jgi:D-alanyl-D-alanine carboxypeptidase
VAPSTSTRSRSYAPLLPRSDREAFARLDRADAVLSRTAATLRDVRVGDQVELAGGRTLRVAHIVDDELVGAAELVVIAGSLRDVRTPRYLLVRYRGDRGRVEDAIRLTVPSELGVRFRAPAEATILRHGDAVLPQAWIKRDFGEWIDTDASATISPDAGFVDQIDEFTLDGLGTVRCHRKLEVPLRRAIDALSPEAAALLDGTETVCFEPRSSQNASGPSHHSWGIAIDLDIAVHVKAGVGDAPAGMIEAFAAAGFVWGGDWLDPDPVHFEWVGTSVGR